MQQPIRNERKKSVTINAAVIIVYVSAEIDDDTAKPATIDNIVVSGSGSAGNFR